MKKILIKLTLMLALIGTPLLTVSSPAYAIDCNNPKSAQEAIQCGASGAAGQDVKSSDTVDSLSKDSGSKLSNTIKSILNILSIIIGIAAIVMIIIGGFRYVTSGGKQESVSAAKNTILYAIVGLIIVAFAQVIVHFVLEEATSASSTSSKPKKTP